MDTCRVTMCESFSHRSFPDRARGEQAISSTLRLRGRSNSRYGGRFEDEMTGGAGGQALRRTRSSIRGESSAVPACARLPSAEPLMQRADSQAMLTSAPCAESCRQPFTVIFISRMHTPKCAKRMRAVLKDLGVPYEKDLSGKRLRIRVPLQDDTASLRCTVTFLWAPSKDVTCIEISERLDPHSARAVNWHLFTTLYKNIMVHFKRDEPDAIVHVHLGSFA